MKIINVIYNGTPKIMIKLSKKNKDIRKLKKSFSIEQNKKNWSNNNWINKEM